MENKEVTASRCLKNPKDYYNDVTVKKMTASVSLEKHKKKPMLEKEK